MRSNNKPIINDTTIETLLMGTDPQEGIRYIDTNNYSNVAKVFVRKPKSDKVECFEYKYRPFLWFKGFNFDTDFCWKTFAVPEKYFDNELKVFIRYGQKFSIDDVNYKVSGFSPDESEVYISEFLHDINDRKKLCKEKMAEYKVSIEETITTFSDKKIDRLEEGFKFLVHIDEPSETIRPTNPLFHFNHKGKRKRITGSYSNLIDFFNEGGISVWKRSGVFLDGEKIYDLYQKNDPYKILWTFFNLLPYDNLFYDFEAIDITELNEFIFEKFNEKIKVDKSLAFLYDKFLSVGGKELLNKYCSELIDILPATISADKIKDVIDNEYSFESKKIFKLVKESLDSEDIDIFRGEDRIFFTLPSIEQFMIQSGKRNFKGYEDYSDLKIMSLDIETKALPQFINNKMAALSPNLGMIFKIGLYCNNGFSTVIDAENAKEESEAIVTMFKHIMDQSPDLIVTYNGDMFDIPFILKRFEILNKLKDADETIDKILDILSPYYEHFDLNIFRNSIFNQRTSNLKLGGNSEKYVQTTILGMNIVDTMAAVKRAAAIDKEIPNNKLKDNIKHAKLNKSNRVYVQGDQIGFIENDVRPYYLNEKTGEYFCAGFDLQFNNGFDIDLIRRGTDNRLVYGNFNTLYVADSKIDPIDLKDCRNVLVFNSDKMFDLDFEQYLSIFINNIFVQSKNYPTVIFNKNVIGSANRDFLPEQYAVIIKQLQQLRANIFNPQYFTDANIEDYIEVKGKEIIKRYLIDDLWETVALDERYSQATFEISKWLPTSYQRCATMGGASVWKMLLAAWSYQEGIAIPNYDEPRDFSGGLVGLVSLGFHGKSVKVDFSSLYPSEFIEHVPNPSIDITCIYKPFMAYGLKTRLKYKKLKGQCEEQGDYIAAMKWDKKQLPLKILINSFYGMMGAAMVSPFAEIVIAEWVTCNGRQQIRHIIRWMNDRGFKVHNFHTDGAFFDFGTYDENYVYVGKGLNWLVEKDKEYKGIAAYVAEYNDCFLKGVMGLDIDEIVESIVNFAKGNYVYFKLKKNKKTGLLEENITYVGGAIKKKNQSEYIVDFLSKNLVTLMKGQADEFLNAYWDYLQKIYKREIDIQKIASKARVRKTITEYKEHMKKTNKKGAPLSAQAHMELCLKYGIEPELGDWVYYVNTGEKEDEGDSSRIQTKIGSFNLEVHNKQHIESLFKSKDKSAFKKYILNSIENETFVSNSKMMDGDINLLLEDLEKWNNIKLKQRILKKNGSFLDLFKVENKLSCDIVHEDNKDIQYNVALYIKKFNAAIHPLFLCFDNDLRKKIIIKNPSEKPMVLSSELKLVCGIPFEDKMDVQDSLDELLELSESEKRHWATVGYSPDSFLDIKDPI